MNKNPVLRTWTPIETDYGPNPHIQVYGGLRRIGKQAPYFSITGEIYSGVVTNDGRFHPTRDEAGGCIHDEILKVHPDLKPLVDLHLSDMDGVPMHATANGTYWLVGCLPPAAGHFKSRPREDEQTCLRNLQSHFRLSPEAAEGLIVTAADHVIANTSQYERVYTDRGRQVLLNFVEQYVLSQREHWKRLADDAIRTFNLQIYGD